LRLADEVLSSSENDADVVLARASTLFEWERYHEALPEFIRAEALGSTDFNLYLRAGWTCLRSANAAAGEPWMRKAIAAEPTEWTAHFGLATSLRGQGRIDEAVAAYEAALALSPGNRNCLAQLSDCMLARKQPALAEAYSRTAIAAGESVPIAWSNLGVALIAQDRFEEAAAAFEHAARIEEETGGASDGYLNQAICLRDAGRVHEALALYERRLPTLPAVGVNTHYAQALLTAGRFLEGWHHYEFRWMQPPLLALRPSFRKPVWGRQDLRGKTILLRTEQGIGDVIQFIRYAPHVKMLGATVILQLRPGVGELAKGFPGVDRIPGPDEPYPDFDYYIHLMSLPRVFGTELASIPATVPYLRTDPSRCARWKARLGDDVGFKVGLVWAGDANHVRDRYRSITLEMLAPLAAVDDIAFYSLQKGAAAKQTLAAPAGMQVIDLADDLDDFADTAAVIDNLDLVICVDTSVAHLAGALGKPVWLLLAEPSEWRWMTDREDSPWYPTMRMFRQHRQGDWGAVIERVTHALTEHVKRNRHSDPVASSVIPSGNEGATPIPGKCEVPPALRGLSAVAETPMGIVQYFPEQPEIGDSIRWYGEYLRLQTAVLSQLMKAGDRVVEAGAGIGAHVLALAPSIGGTGHWYAYEPRPLLQQVLRQNLAANGVTNVTVMRRSLGLPVLDRGVGVPRAPPDTDQPAASETIDELRLARLDWIKVGENHDALAVLAGASESLWRLRPSLFIAADVTAGVRDIGAHVRDYGYQCWSVTTPLFNPSNFNGRDTDIFCGRTALAVLAIPEEDAFEVAFDGCEPLS
jgi:tetratricopeptide (TPR) repeat protein